MGDTRSYGDRKKLYEGGAEVIRAEWLESMWKEKFAEFQSAPPRSCPSGSECDLARSLEIRRHLRARRRLLPRRRPRRSTKRRRRRRSNRSRPRQKNVSPTRQKSNSYS